MKKPKQEKTLSRLEGEDYDYSMARRTARRCARESLRLTGKGIRVLAGTAYGLILAAKRRKPAVKAHLVIGNQKHLTDIRIKVRRRKNKMW